MSARTEPRPGDTAVGSTVALAQARIVRWPLVGLLCAAAATPVLWALVRGGREVGIAAIAAALIGGAIAGLAVEDPTEVIVAASPTARAHRRGLRLAWVLGSVAGTWAVVAALAVLVGASSSSPVALLAALATTSAGGSVVAASRAANDPGFGEPGLAGVAGGLLACLVVGAVAMRVDWLPALAEPGDADIWAVLATVSVLAAAAGWRDPAARRPHV